MSHNVTRRIARLEDLVNAHHRREQETRARTRDVPKVFLGITLRSLCALILYGEPKPEESLRLAWQRCLEKEEWREFRERREGLAGYQGDNATPFNAFGARQIDEYFRSNILPSLPGNDDTEKLSLILCAGEPWLLWFMFADFTAWLFGFKIRDLSKMSRFARQQPPLGYLPEGPFQFRRLPKGVHDVLHMPARVAMEKKMANMTSREQKRYLRIIGEK